MPWLKGLIVPMATLTLLVSRQVKVYRKYPVHTNSPRCIKIKTGGT